MKKGVIKKSLIATAIISATSFTSNANAGFWCGSPICPGDIVFDATRDAAEIALQNIKNNFVDNTLNMLKDQYLEETSRLAAQEMQNSLNLSLKKTGQITDVISDTFNKRMLSDLKPTTFEACNVVTWQKNTESNSEKLSEDITMTNAVETASRAIKGESESNTTIKKRQFRQILELKNANPDRSIFDVDTLYSNDILVGDDIRSSLLAVDILVNPELEINRQIQDDEINAYKEEYVNNTRKALFLNAFKMQLLQPINKRSGAGNARTNIEDISADFSPDPDDLKLSYEDSPQNFTNIVNDISDNEIEEGEEADSEEFETGNIYPPDTTESVLANFPPAPLKFTRISSHFNRERVHPVTGEVKPHNGVDFAGPVGTPIVAPADGTITLITEHFAAGKYMIIDHGAGVTTRYLHLNGYPDGITSGMSVKRGDLIAFLGNTGRSTGPHLHYEIKIDGVPVDPIAIFGISENEIKNNLERGILGEHRFSYELVRSVQQDAADAFTLSSQSLRKELLTIGLSMDRAMEEYKELEQIKFNIALDIILKLDPI